MKQRTPEQVATVAANTQIVINWHTTEVCNYSCGYCYAKYSQKPDSRELFHSKEKAAMLARLLSEFFTPKFITKHHSSPLVRLNIAGGEPLLYLKNFNIVADFTTSAGMAVSCITNGSTLSEAIIGQIAPKLSFLAVSVDSLNPVTNRKIGRNSKNGLLDLKKLTSLLALARQCNPDIKIKINTVVNKHNAHENLSTFIEEIAPDKWKVLQVLPVITCSFNVVDYDYAAFVNRHASFKRIMTVEDNKAMTHSYLMIDPNGRFYQNKEGQSGYDYSDPILDVGVETALLQINFNAERFIGRY